MRFFACVQAPVTVGENWASAGEPVMPNFPTGYSNSFLGTISFKPTMKAEVKEFPELNLDEMVDRLHKQYPGLPRSMLETYVLETAKAAYEIEPGSECSVYNTWEATSILDLATGELHTLWTTLPK